MKDVKKVESAHLGNGKSITKIKLNLNKTIKKPSPCVSTRCALKNQADDFSIDFDSDFAKLNEILKVFSKGMFHLIKPVLNLRTTLL